MRLLRRLTTAALFVSTFACARAALAAPEPGEILARESERDRPAEPPKEAADGKKPSDWCAPELEALPHDVCYAKGPKSKAGKRTLVIFLHGLVQEGSGWQHSLQKGLANAGKRLGFSLFAPRGRLSAGSSNKDDTYAWPSKSRAVEDEVVEEWMQAKALVEKREGASFDEVYVMGFSNGAFYAASLALRGRLDVDGYAVFAGGAAHKGTLANAKAVKNKKPIFLGIASKDDTAKDERELAKALKKAKWPSRSISRPVGHVVADDHLEKALEFLRGGSALAKGDAADADEKREPADDGSTSTKKKKTKKKKTAEKSKSKKNKKR